MKRELLKGLTVIDFSHRLPGPLAGHILTTLGAEVIKIEDVKYKDPFITQAFTQMDESFKDWYQELNGKKTIERYNFSSEIELRELKERVFGADAILMGLPTRMREKLGLTQEELLECPHPIAVIEMLASFSHKESLHDLNALALSGLMPLYLKNRNERIVPPPFLPIAGISFGQKIATDLLAAIVKAMKTKKTVFTKSYLYETTEEILGAFWPKKLRDSEYSFLHNGHYPCYNLYRLKDENYLAVAAVEEKFWNRFSEVLNLNITSEERFNPDPAIKEKLADAIELLSSEQAQRLLVNEDICVSLIDVNLYH